MSQTLEELAQETQKDFSIVINIIKNSSSSTIFLPERFPDPQQVRSATFFTMDWIPQSVAGRFNYTGFSEEKVKYGIESTLNFWYKLKYSINDIESVLKGEIW